MEINKWVGGYKIHASKWIDGKRIYFNVQYFAPGQSIERPPVWDKSVYVTDDEAGHRLVSEFTATLADYVAGMEIRDGMEVTITAERVPTFFAERSATK